MLPIESVPQPLSQTPTPPADRWEVMVAALRKRELLIPLLLVGTGYGALPFLVKQLVLFLAPMAVLLGITGDEREQAE
ncbi:MAG: hypothetical protein KF832_15220 [Caldilineaceae bacterium]|nr:hypothetical protein [Caldilineaceae bacterium]